MDASRGKGRGLRRERGFSMIEVLVSILIMVVGLLGLAAMQAFAHQAELESYQRAQALIVLNDIVDRINANRRSGGCFAFTTDTTNGTPWIGDSTGGAHLGVANCGSGFENTLTKAAVDAAVNELDGLLKGSAETKTISGTPTAVGAMIGARACVSRDAATNIYTIVVSWQGMTESFLPVKACAKGKYGDAETAATKRRAVWTTIKIGSLG